MDETEFAAYADEAWPTLVRAAVFLGCSLADAEDAAQSTLVKCFRSWAKVTGADNREAYVYRMLVNTVRDSHRRPWRRERSHADVPHDRTGRGHDPHGAVEVTDAVHRALGGLSKVNRDVVVLRYFVQLTEAQTAAALDVAPGTVKSRLSRALAQLATDHHLADLTGRTHP
ncbi:sigma-70 family RNA polymerase sigma factor [Nocardioides sp. SOB77]|uniref:Sigma-70 family RNA polymerase sigma factor n=1 Tax=Nocardioides oceani TaxID=3058369 RepID=A0ABT8FHG5_9ACTN|nr:sigma-70 family RNA polymerase sigma factor [Nocardioides oceani]MDN4173996.1 sigma-70 family RNA polymerase sigma factor [Nocardioides oceani]